MLREQVGATGAGQRRAEEQEELEGESAAEAPDATSEADGSDEALASNEPDRAKDDKTPDASA